MILWNSLRSPHASRLLLLFALLLQLPSVQAQLVVGSAPDVELRYLVDLPTAGTLRRGEAALDLQAGGRGTLLVKGSIGVSNRFSLGLSYGGTSLLGTGKPGLYPLPGVFATFRIFDESKTAPALLIGFDSQGRRGIVEGSRNYEIKSPGFYAVLSRNYAFYGTMSTHVGVNYSFEHYDGREQPNFFGGVEKSVGEFASCIVEYNAGLNNAWGAGNNGKGFLNVGLWINLGAGMAIGASARDLLESSPEGGERIIQLQYVFDPE